MGFLAVIAIILVVFAVGVGVDLLLTWGASSILHTPFWPTFVFVFAFTWLVGAIGRSSK